MFFRKLISAPPRPKQGPVPILFEKEGQPLSLASFEALTGAPFLSYLDFDSDQTYTDVLSRGAKQAKNLSREQLWLGSYYKKELLDHHIPDLAIRWLSPDLGWGVFAGRDFKKMEFIAEYTGKLRKRRRADVKNAYCFEYVVVSGAKTPYTIDALEQGGAARYINHSANPNLTPHLATLDSLSHVILLAARPIAKGEQLTYDYGPDYWAKRSAPQVL